MQSCVLTGSGRGSEKVPRRPREYARPASPVAMVPEPKCLDVVITADLRASALK